MVALQLHHPARGRKRKIELNVKLGNHSTLYSYITPQGDGNPEKGKEDKNPQRLYSYITPQGDGN